MNWEGQVYGFANPNAQPPTPIPTPTSATGSNFGSTPFCPESPEATEFDSRQKRQGLPHQDYMRSFYQTPHSLEFSPDSRRPSTSSTHKRQASDQHSIAASSIVHVPRHSRNADFPESPVKSSSQSAKVPSPTKRARQLTPVKFGSYLDADQSIHSAGSIQTPPPTRTMAERSEKRKASMARAQANFDGAGYEFKGMSLPSGSPTDGYGPAQQSTETSQLFQNQSQMIDMFGYPISGPATAPVFPQQKLFWDSSSDMNGIAMEYGHGGDYTMLNNNPGWGALDGQIPRTLDEQPNGLTFSYASTSQNMMSQSMAEDSENFSNTAAFSFSQASAAPSATYPYMPAISDGVVNPNLIFSQPPASGPTMPSHYSETTSHRPQPYQYQTQELEREKQLENVRKARLPRLAKAPIRPKPGLSNQNSQHPGLKRSVSDGMGFKMNKSRKPGEALVVGTAESLHNGQANRDHRRSSFARSTQPSALGSIPEQDDSRPRTQISFTIDHNGHARAEAKVIIDEPEWEHEEDDTESESSTDSDSPGLISCQSSFTFPTGQKERPKLARFRTAPSTLLNQDPTTPITLSPSSRSDIYGHSTSSSSLSSPSKGAAQRVQEMDLSSTVKRGRGSHISLGGSTVQRTDLLAFHSFQPGEGESEAETVLETDEIHDVGTAQHAIKQLLKQKQQQEHKGASNTRSAKKVALSSSRIYSSPRSILQQHEIGRIQQDIHDTSTNDPNLSPTTVTDPDIASTPKSSDRDNGETRCVCQSVAVEGLMILCDSCNKWLHAKCVNIRSAALPEVYICVYCTGQTPVTRGGRVRAPRKNSNILSSSPLARKGDKSNKSHRR